MILSTKGATTSSTLTVGKDQTVMIVTRTVMQRPHLIQILETVLIIIARKTALQMVSIKKVHVRTLTAAVLVELDISSTAPQPWSLMRSRSSVTSPTTCQDVNRIPALLINLYPCYFHVELYIYLF